MNADFPPPNSRPVMSSTDGRATLTVLRDAMPAVNLMLLSAVLLSACANTTGATAFGDVDAPLADGDDVTEVSPMDTFDDGTSPGDTPGDDLRPTDASDGGDGSPVDAVDGASDAPTDAGDLADDATSDSRDVGADTLDTHDGADDGSDADDGDADTADAEPPPDTPDAPPGGCLEGPDRAGDPCCVGVRTGVLVCEADVLRCSAPDALVTIALPHGTPGDRRALDDWHDTAVFLSTLQGVVNREHPWLYIDGTSHDGFWWERLTGGGGPMSGRATASESDPFAVYDRFSCAVRGLVVWDPGVAATLNVGTSVAGAEDLALVRHDTRGDSLYQRLLARPEPPPVVVDLAGLFTGSGTIAGTGRHSSGSAKCDAYLWLLAHYIETGRLDHRWVGYLVDAWWLDHSLGPNVTQAFNRDWFVANRSAPTGPRSKHSSVASGTCTAAAASRRSAASRPGLGSTPTSRTPVARTSRSPRSGTSPEFCRATMP